MPEILALIGSSLSIAKSLKDASDKIKDIEIKSLTADLTLKLAEIKMKLTEVMQEKIALENRVREFENSQVAPCPKCQKRTWEIKESYPHPTFGHKGVSERAYLCSACGFTEKKLIKP